MDLLVIGLAAVPLVAALLVFALGAAVRRAPRLDYEAEARAALAHLRSERSPDDPPAGAAQA